ncbi:hypothetical protein RI367_001678 [Sorochytrium milnesiophthora]
MLRLSRSACIAQAQAEGVLAALTCRQQRRHASDTAAPTGERETSSSQARKAAPARELRSSRVPTTRLGRFMQYGGLATQLGIGAISEAARRAGGAKPLIDGSSPLLSEANISRLVHKLSEMRGAALKLGQMISIQDSGVLPKKVEEVLTRVQNSANYMPADQMTGVLVKELGPQWKDNFSSFDEKPFAAASIGQVHQAVLSPKLSAYPANFRVAVKLQYPGIAKSIDSDLGNLKSLAMLSGLMPKGMYLDNTIEVARRELHWETDYLREIDCMRQFRHLLLTGKQEAASEAESRKLDATVMEGDFVVPRVIDELCTDKVLVMEYVDGVPLGEVADMPANVRNSVAERLLQLCLQELMEFSYMQTDPNWSNFLYDAKTDQIKLLDFGSTRSFSQEFMDMYVNLLDSAAKSDREGVLLWSEKIGFLTGFETEVLKDAHTTAVMVVAEPFRHDEYDFAQSRSVTQKVRSMIPTILEHRLSPPPDEIYSLHRKLSGMFLLCAKLGAKINARALFYDAINKYRQRRGI